MNPQQPGASGRRGIAPGVDLDLLADYAGGALEGTPEGVRAAALVASDPAWADALEILRAADAMVRVDLTRLAETPQPLPSDVADRLGRALDLARSEIPADRSNARDPAGSEDLAGSEDPTERDRPVDLRTARLRRRFRIAAVAAVAAGVVALAVPATNLVLGQNGTVDSEAGRTAESDRTAAEGDAPAPEAGLPRDQGQGSAHLGRFPVPVTASGSDYTRDTVRTVHGLRPVTDPVPQAPEGLSRLLAGPALGDCLAAIRSAHRGTVRLVDYARFEGAPALVVAITGDAGDRLTVVAGPECGRSGGDERYATTT